MSKKIINIIVFVIAGISCLLALWFSMSFDDSKKDLYYEATIIEGSNPQVISDLQAVSIASLPAFVSAKTEDNIALSANLKEKQYQKDIFYTYIVELKDLNEDSFAEYKAQFSEHANFLFSKSDSKDKFVKGFDRVANFNDLNSYIHSLEEDYDVIKQDYLKDKTYLRAYGNLLKRSNDINDVVSESKKTADLSALQQDIKTAAKEVKLLNSSILFVYLIFFIAIAMVLFFSILGIITNFKTSYQILLWGALLVFIFIMGYFIASPELSKSAITLGYVDSEVRWIEAGLILFYTLLMGAILSIIVSPFINKIKKV